MFAIIYGIIFIILSVLFAWRIVKTISDLFKRLLFLVFTFAVRIVYSITSLTHSTMTPLLIPLLLLLLQAGFCWWDTLSLSQPGLVP
jgi:heme A synthase